MGGGDDLILVATAILAELGAAHNATFPKLQHLHSGAWLRSDFLSLGLSLFHDIASFLYQRPYFILGHLGFLLCRIVDQRIKVNVCFYILVDTRCPLLVSCSARLDYLSASFFTTFQYFQKIYTARQTKYTLKEVSDTSLPF